MSTNKFFRFRGMVHRLFMILFMAAFLPTTLFAYDFMVDGLCYDINPNGNSVTITSANSSLSGALVIPSSVSNDGNTYSVTQIGALSLHGHSGLTSITIGRAVTSIGERAFYNCNGLTNIVVDPNNPVLDSRNNCNAVIETSTNKLIAGCKTTVIPNTVTSIGYMALYGFSGLTSVSIPPSVTSIAISAFGNCSDLTNMVVESGNPVYDSRNSCNAIIETASNKLISGCKATIIPNTVSTIGSCAFFDCTELPSISIPNSVTTIADHAFTRCDKLTSITIPSSVSYIGEDALADCDRLTSIIVDPENAIFDSRDNCNAVIETATNTLISGCRTTLIPNTVTSIAKRAFLLYTGMTSIVIPNSVTSIGEEAFYGCSDLTSLTIGSSVSSIGMRAFLNCMSLTSVTNLATTPQTINSNVFDGVNISNVDLFVLEGCEEAYRMATVWKDFRLIEEIETPSAPTFSPQPGTYYKVVNISITSETPGAEIHVTFRGETPTENSFLLTKELTLTKSYTIKAVAIKDGVTSKVVSGVYTITDEHIIDPDQFVFTKVMETNDDMVASSNGRFSTGYDNAVYVTDKSAGTIYKYDASGNRSEFTGGLPSGIGSAITSDDAGNILIQNGWAGAGGAKNWIIIEPDETRYDLTLDYDNSGVNAARLDASGRIVGNVLSQEGAYWCLLPGNGTNGAVIKLANGEQVSITPVESGITADYTSIAQPIFSYVSNYDEDPTSGWAFRKRGNGSITRDVSRSYSDGFDIFKLGENTYTVEPIGTNYCDGYAIFQDGVAEPVAVKEETISSGSQRYQSLTARVSEDGTCATIYQNVSGYCASIYQFGMPPTGVDKVSTSDEASVVSTAYYNLQGVRVMNPAAGQILIKVNTLSNGQIRASKIAVK